VEQVTVCICIYVVITFGGLFLAIVESGRGTFLWISTGIGTMMRVSVTTWCWWLVVLGPCYMVFTCFSTNSLDTFYLINGKIFLLLNKKYILNKRVTFGHSVVSGVNRIYEL
jgi:hypothetical protein